jgi:hypothetical protein
VSKYARRHKSVAIVGFNEKSAEFHDRLSGTLNIGH